MIFIDTENPETVSRENKNKFSLSRLQILVGLVLKQKIKYTKTQEGCTGLCSISSVVIAISLPSLSYRLAFRCLAP